ncbi:unnamed protein product [Kuraishia capsulata CBS 1993]|uniref:C2 domain-containing protein n=1 Tax=Kuraishia capsulata CBS 1993 TaxID=1382522 RepID=W6MTY8_9ASCO|nr:uncharacterized protein KUCA_T00001289001 [Kuraishia capsulata CBS 1993]CDK25320.1 unnamed protein product [Kuraishia capsulata CBS 1993]
MKNPMAYNDLQREENQLVIVVTKAQNLPNRKKLDKQSPYCVARIQDQIQKTKVVHRGGQNPEWDDELWFSLDDLSGSVVIFTIYHQTKKDEELVCKADIDFSIVMKRSSKEGYDAWFPLEYEGRPAGRIYLQMTYYPSATSVPTVVENAPRLLDSRPKLTRPLPPPPVSAAKNFNSQGSSPNLSREEIPRESPENQSRWPSMRSLNESIQTKTLPESPSFGNRSSRIRPISRSTPSMTQSVDCDGYLGQRFQLNRDHRQPQIVADDDSSSESDSDAPARRVQKPAVPTHRVPLSPMNGSLRGTPAPDAKGSWNILGSFFPSGSTSDQNHDEAWSKRSAALGARTDEPASKGFHIPNPMDFLSGWRE